MEVNSKVGAGRFTLVKPLGRGGMGEVWLAQDERLHEPAALKFLPPEVRADPGALDELRRETARSHKLSHANIVRIHDLHEEDGGLAFIAMEYVEGLTLAALRLQQPERVLTWEYLRPLAQQLCAALEYAHGEKVIHRDLKPANMMVDGKGRLKLADFGIAATVSDSVSRISLRHATSGTLAYMSPQQVAGKRPQVGDDVYALGATLYELLTSKPPFYTGDITHQVLHESPESLEERLVGLGIQNDIPPDVSAIIMACLAKAPAQRPQSAQAVAEWVGLEVGSKPSSQRLTSEVFGASRPGESVGPSEAGEARPASRGPRGKLILAGAVTVALVLVALGGRYLISRPRTSIGHPAQRQTVIPEPDSSTARVESASPPVATKPEISPPAATPAAAVELGFTPLFNGHDLSGWDGDPKIWSVRNGTLTGQATKDANRKGGSFLIWTNGEVSDFELRFSFRVPQNNSGITYRGKNFGNWAVFGGQYVITDLASPGGELGQFFEHGAIGNQPQWISGRGHLGTPGDHVVVSANRKFTSAGIPQATKAQALAAAKLSDWNEGVIIARGEHITHLLNGVVVTEVRDRDLSKRSLSGVLAIQAHAVNEQGALVEFKNIRFKPLDSSASVSTDTTAPRAEAGYVSLFNGRDLTGWHLRDPKLRNHWSVENGSLKMDVKTGQPGNDLITDKKFWNFKVSYEFMVSDGANSGMYLRGRHEIQILGDYATGTRSLQGNGAFYKFKMPDQFVSRPGNEWQTVEATVVGNRITVVQNGVKIHDNVQCDKVTGGGWLDEAVGQPGPLLLQAHPGTAYFRNLRIKELK